MQCNVREVNHQHSVTSQIFSSADIHDGARWQFCSITHVPSVMPRSIILLAIGPWPWPSESEANFWPPKPCQFHNISNQSTSVIKLISTFKAWLMFNARPLFEDLPYQAAVSSSSVQLPPSSVPETSPFDLLPGCSEPPASRRVDLPR